MRAVPEAVLLERSHSNLILGYVSFPATVLMGERFLQPQHGFLADQLKAFIMIVALDKKRKESGHHVVPRTRQKFHEAFCGC